MPVKAKHFDILSKIGTGNFGNAEIIRRKHDDKIFVWKKINFSKLSEEYKGRTRREVHIMKMMRNLNNPYIVQIQTHFMDRTTQFFYIVMEFCPGGDLNQRIMQFQKAENLFDEAFIHRVLKQMCEALKACHERYQNKTINIVHRDIKPHNIFLDQNDNIKLGDFGFAAPLTKGIKFAHRRFGSFEYTSPEIIKAQLYDTKTDIWSLGIVIYQMCALRLPFEGSTPKESAHKICKEDCPTIPEKYSDSLYRVINSLLQKKGEDRPTALELLQDPYLLEDI